MSRRYTELTFTDGVKALQERYGVRKKAAKAEHWDLEDQRLSERERDFIARRDSFYLASVLENGWPYVNHRGGPRGFLHVLDERTLAYADFRGNLQYISMGNVAADDRVALFLMDYPARERLKIMARAQVLEAAERPDLVERLEHPEYRARIERVVLLHVEAFDWNCPQHITPRYSEEEVLERERELLARIRELESKGGA